MLQFAKLYPCTHARASEFFSIRIKFGRADLTALGERVVRILLRRSRHRRQLIRDDCDFEMPRSASFGAAHQGQSQPQRCLNDSGYRYGEGACHGHYRAVAVHRIGNDSGQLPDDSGLVARRLM